ncbi:MAG: hypothetical protein IT320_04100 [Anaerolineae bacterium]|nr:hypothetical protein [Anaerolineae bacterium]
MAQSQPPEMKRGLLRAQIAVAVLAVLAVGGFIGLWNVLGGAGFEDFPRLILSMCLPPAFIAILVGIYVLVFRSRGS